MIPATVVAAASFDDAIAITGYTLFINLAVNLAAGSDGSTGWNVAHGPLSIAFGTLAGILAGGVCSLTKLWNNPLKRTLVMFLTGARLPPALRWTPHTPTAQDG